MTDLYTVALEALLASDDVHTLPAALQTVATAELRGVSCV